MSKKLINKSSKKVIAPLKNFGPIVMALATGQPLFATIFIAATGIISYFGDLAQKRINELAEAMNSSKDDFVYDVIKNDPDKFKAIFLDVLDRSIRETNEEKRKLLRNFLINVFKGAEQNFNYYSRLLWVLNNITLDELKVINNFNTIPSQKLEKNEYDIKNKGVNTMHIQQYFEKKELKFKRDYLETLLWSLAIYGFLIASTGRWGGTFWIGPTDLGNKFLKFIKQ